MSKRDFRQMTAAEAEAFFAAYVAAGPERIEWLRARTGLALEPGRTGLVDLWRWFLGWAAAGGTEEPVAGLPMWAVPSRPEQGEPLRWDDPRAREVAAPHPPDLSPAAEWVVDAMSYYLVERIREADPRLGYRLSREDERKASFNQPVVDCAGTKMPEYAVPVTRSWATHAIAPASEYWEAEARRPEALASFHDQILERAAKAKPGKKVPPPRSAAEVLARRGIDGLFEVGRGADGELVVDFDEELSVVGGAAVDCVASKLPGAARTDREVITVPGGGDPETVRTAVREHLLACIRTG